MSGEIITRDDDLIKSFFSSLDRMLNGIERLVNTHKPMLNGEHYLTDKEVSEKLKISRRALQNYRDQGLIPYCQLGGGKILYRESDIQKLLEAGYRKAW